MEFPLFISGLLEETHKPNVRLLKMNGEDLAAIRVLVEESLLEIARPGVAPYRSLGGLDLVVSDDVPAGQVLMLDDHGELVGVISTTPDLPPVSPAPL